MTNIALELDSCLRTLDPSRAAALEQIVSEAIAVSTGPENGTNPATSHSTTVDALWPPGFLEQIRKDWGNEPFERPKQAALGTDRQSPLF